MITSSQLIAILQDMEKANGTELYIIIDTVNFTGAIENVKLEYNMPDGEPIVLIKGIKGT